ncbi:hypothetical protein RND71_021730 [Anisodus tanguticus]|uniref:Uncharacterized protein n=1 Tax=Anisodus tanguticus TaxID=243964 RepID=A0AAE1VD57_9SOLA|nr:hypothetical protein RND71_021730 [Anisodus tanguticus]
MGNSLGRGKRTVKVMTIDGQTMKLKTPVYAREVLKDYPGSVLLESESVKHFGIRAKPLEYKQELKPKRLYFMVEMPKEEKVTRRVSSGIQISAKDRLESLMLARRSVSDISLMKPAASIVTTTEEEINGTAVMRMKLRLPKAEVEKMMQSNHTADIAENIMRLCMLNNNTRSCPLLDKQDYGKDYHKKGIKSQKDFQMGMRLMRCDS